MTRVEALAAEQLRTVCDADTFSFRTTDELEDLGGMLGQDRALAALRFGIGMPNSGYNLFVLGPAGTGKHTAVARFLQEKSASETVPGDWVYVNNFADGDKPLAIDLQPGRGKALRRDMQQLVEELRTAVPAAFESEDYKARIQHIEDDFEQRQEEFFHHIKTRANQHDVNVFKRPGGFTFAPIRDGEALDADAFHKLPEDEQKRINTVLEELQQELQDGLQNKIPGWYKERRARIKQVNDEVTMNAVGHLISSLRDDYRDLPRVLDYLDEVQEDLIANVNVFLEKPDAEQGILELSAEMPLRRYQVNLLVDHSGSKGAPVIYEDNPTYAALVGRVEHIAQLGALITSFTQVKEGALHRANGGYLILDARKLLTQPYAWEGLKRALYSKEIRIESLGQMLSLVSTVSLEPEPIPLKCKVVLMGERLLYYLLCELDPDFSELFKVAADFEDRLDRTAGNDNLYAQLVATLVRKDKLHPFDRTAVAAVIEQSMRMAGDSERLSAHMRGVADLLREASYWAGEAGRDVVGRDDVQHAIDYRIERLDRVRDRMHEAIQRNTIMIDTDGAVSGQVNGLSVIELGEIAFGIPVRITANTRLGEGELIDIEREVELGGPIHSKGVFILSGYLGARYAQHFPLSLGASLVFEQSYGEVEGDSASLAELCALLSSLARLPVRQSLAVTGSVNQRGQVQAIGGVNEKIEGFFDVCRERGLSGDQGVMIPASNVKHLMLRNEVVDAVRDGKFHIFAVEEVDQAIELFTGVPAGEQDEEGGFPLESVNGLVQARLQSFAGLRQQYSSAARDVRANKVADEPQGDSDDSAG